MNNRTMSLRPKRNTHKKARNRIQWPMSSREGPATVRWPSPREKKIGLDWLQEEWKRKKKAQWVGPAGVRRK